MATPQIQTPDYQGYADRITPALDKLLIGFKEKRQREAEERQFARKKVLMNAQQDFQREMQEDQQSFRGDVHANQERIQMKVLGIEQEYNAEQAETQREFQSGQAELGREHDYGMAETQHGYQMDQITSQLGATQTQTQTEALRDNFADTKESFENDYREILEDLGVEYSFGTNKGGTPTIQVGASGFGDSAMTFAEFENSKYAQNLRTGYNYLQDIKSQKDEIARVSEFENSATDLPRTDTSGDQPHTYYKYENMVSGIRNEMKNGKPNIIQKMSQGIAHPDTRPRVDERDLSLLDMRTRALSGKPIQVNTTSGGDPEYTFDFKSMTYGDLNNNLLELSAEEGTATSETRSGDNAQREVRNRQMKAIQERMEYMHGVVMAYAENEGITDMDQLNNLRLNTGDVDLQNPSSFMIGSGQESTQRTQQPRNSSRYLD